jgi:hypothetical protein
MASARAAALQREAKNFVRSEQSLLLFYQAIENESGGGGRLFHGLPLS